MVEEMGTAETTNSINSNRDGGDCNRGATFRKLSDEEMQNNIKEGDYVSDVMRSLGLVMFS